MSTAAVPQKITVCPPRPAGNERDLHFDRYVAARRSYPVNAEFDGDAFSSTGISFEDYSRMTTQQRKQSGERRLPTPEWGNNDLLLRSLLVSYLESRARLRGRQPGTEKERLERAVQHIAAANGRIKSVLQKMCDDYVALRKNGTDPARLEMLQQEIENYDSTLRVNANPAAIVLGIVRYYYRVGLDSVGVAYELGLKPPAVRQTLWRLHRVWKRMHEWRGPRMQINVVGDWRPKAKIPRNRKLVVRSSKIDVQIAATMFAEGKPYREIGKAVGASPATVIYALRTRGLWKPRHTGKVDIKIAAEMFAAGKSYQQMARFFGVKKETVWAHLKKHGYWKPRPCGRPRKQVAPTA